MLQKVKEEFQELHSHSIYAFTLKMIGYRPDVVEEITQETLY